MKVRVSYTAEVSDEYRRAIRRYHGQTGMATRQEVKDWFWAHGEQMDDELMGTYGDPEDDNDED